ncbi:MAG: helix-turn-helix domain-containing protein [Ignavibacteriales bacterium]|nr:helix-turn-helix domain-containing protein [Ignavibacteriales bacterium]
MALEKEISSIVRFHRKKSGLSQAEFAKTAGVGKTVIFDIEKGKQTVRLSTLQKVFIALNIRVSFSSPLMDAFEKSKEEGNANR